MIADIFYPIFTIANIILACFIRKKSKIVQGICTHSFTKALPWTFLEGTPTSIVSCFAKNWCTHIFSILSPDNTIIFYEWKLDMKLQINYLQKDN